MKLANQAMRTFHFAFALLILSRGYVVGQETEPLPETGDAFVARGAEVPISDAPAQALPLDLSNDAGGMPSAEVNPFESADATQATMNQAAAIEPDYDTVAAELAAEAASAEAVPAAVAVEAAPGEFTANDTSSDINEYLSEEAPYPDITEFPIPAAAVNGDPFAVQTADYSISTEEGYEQDTATPAEYAADCNWLVEKLDDYREVQQVSAVVVEQETVTNEFAQEPVREVPVEVYVPEPEPTPAISYTEELAPIEPPVQPALADWEQPAMPAAAPPQQVQPIQQATAIVAQPSGEPQMLTPPAAVVPRSALDQILSSRSVAAVYGVFVGILATLFLLLVTLILRSLLSRMMPRTATAAAEVAPQSQPNTYQPSGGNQPQMGIPPQAQFMAYPQQHAYMPPVMMHPSFVYADVDHRQEERPRRPKSKARSERKRRSNASRKRNSQQASRSQNSFDYESFTDSSTSSSPYQPKPTAEEHPTNQQQTELQSALYKKILEKNLQIRKNDGA